MAAIKKEMLEQIEAKHGLEPGNLTYQQRCSRATAYQQGRGDKWSVEDTAAWRKKEDLKAAKKQEIKDSPIYGKKILITPKIMPDANRALYYEEELGPEMEVEEVNAGEAIYSQPEETQRMLGDYKVKNIRKDKRVVAKSWVPKIGQEISYTLGKDLVPVVEGNDGFKGYIWAYPTRTVPVEAEDGSVTMLQIYGLKTLIETVYPELLDQFSGKPVMSYIDGYVLAASIPQTHAILKRHRRQELSDMRAGLI